MKEREMKRTVLMIAAVGLFLFSQAAKAGWTPAKRITWTSGWSMLPAIVVDSSDHIHVVWEDDTTGNVEIYYKRSTDGGTSWSAARRLTWTSRQSRDSAVAADSNNALHVVWEDGGEGSGQEYDIYYKRSTDGGATWEATKRLTWTASSFSPAIAIDSKNVIHVAWLDDAPGNEEIYYKKSTNGGATWSAAKRLTWSSGLSLEPGIAVGLSDAIHLAWEDDTSGHLEIYYKRSTDGGATWGPSQRLTWTSGAPDFPAIATDLDNGVHVVWRGNTPANYEIYYNRSLNGGTTWDGAKRFTWTSGGSHDPAIAVNFSSGLHVVWCDETPGNYEIYHKSSTDGGTTWSALKRLTWNSGHSGIPAIGASQSNANIHIVWYDDTPGNFEIYYIKGN
jgi:BNR repeat-like domain